MTFVFTFWYFVIFALVAGIVACLVVFFKMDKKDRELIKEFVNEQTQDAESEKEETTQK